MKLSILNKNFQNPARKLLSIGFVFIFLFSAQSLMAKGLPKRISEEQERYPTIALGSKIVMPNKQMKGVDGKDYSILSTMQANGLLVVFSCNTCPFVVKWEDRYPLIKKFCDRFQIGMLMINSNEMRRDSVDSYASMQAHAKAKNYSWPYVMDVNSEVANAFGAKTTPHAFLFDKSYKLVYRGAIDDNYESASLVKEQYVIDAITALASASKVATPDTKPVGCSIKRRVIE